MQPKISHQSQNWYPSAHEEHSTCLTTSLLSETGPASGFATGEAIVRTAIAARMMEMDFILKDFER